MSQSPSPRIPVLDLQRQYRAIGPELEAAVVSVLRSGNYILGKHNADLESRVAALCGCPHGVGVANGTDALTLALWALDIGPGDEVLTPPFTFAATVEAISLRGARPVFVDVDPRTFTIDASQIEAKITARTRAILPVHLYGHPADMGAIQAIARRHNLKVIEDNAQAIGAAIDGLPTGSFGDAACISFYPTKNLGAAGDAGMVVSPHASIAERLRTLRAHGSKVRYFHEELGVNSRLDEVQAAVLSVKLAYLADWNARRRQVAALYGKHMKGLAGVILPTHADNISHVWHQYTIRVLGRDGARRDRVKAALAEGGVDSMCYYPVPLHMQPAFAYLGYARGDFPVSETLAAEVLSLPMYPELSEEEIVHISSVLARVMASLDPAPVMPAGTTVTVN